MATEATNNGNGQRKYWFIIPAIALGSMIAGFSTSFAVTRIGVTANKERNVEQDACIKTNADDIRQLSTTQARIDERLRSIQANVET